jgi:hypothetical protein
MREEFRMEITFYYKAGGNPFVKGFSPRPPSENFSLKKFSQVTKYFSRNNK